MILSMWMKIQTQQMEKNDDTQYDEDGNAITGDE